MSLAAAAAASFTSGTPGAAGSFERGRKYKSWSTCSMDYKKLAKERIESHPFARNLGISVDEIREGEASCSITVKDFMFNPVGSVHGGVLYSLADTTAGCAVISYENHRITTVDGSLHFLRAAMNIDTLYGRAKVIKRGKRLSTVHVEILDPEGKLLDDGTFTFFDLDCGA